MRKLLMILVTGIIMLLIDLPYLMIIKDYFNKLIKDIQGTPIKLDLLASVLCYTLMSIGLWYFILRENREVIDAFILGIVIYGVYEATSKALLKKWDWKTVLLDTLWGGVLFGLTTYIYKQL